MSIDILFKRGLDCMDTQAYGAAANYFYQAIIQNEDHVDSWTGLAFALSLLNQDDELQIHLARYALNNFPLNEDIMPMVLSVYNGNPLALSEWFIKVASNEQLTKDEIANLQLLKQNSLQVLDELKRELDIDDLQQIGLRGLKEIAYEGMFLDMLLDSTEDEILNRIQDWLTYPDNVELGIHALAFFPHTRSVKMLRSFCRNEAIAPIYKTLALQSLKAIGVDGNVKVHKFGDSFVINLSDPMLDFYIPRDMRHIIEWILLWIYKDKHEMDDVAFQRLTKEKISDALLEDLEELEEQFGPEIETAMILLEQAYLYYYPQIPSIEKDKKEWGIAVLHLLKEFNDQIEKPWDITLPELSPGAAMKKEWILEANPDFYEVEEEN